VPTIKRNTPEAELFRCALHKVMLELAKMIVCDGERVTKFVEIRVRNARTLGDARKVAETVAKSLLVKCSFHGCDPNWGRIIHAVGYSGATHSRGTHRHLLRRLARPAKAASPTKTPVTEMEKVVKEPKFTVTIDLNLGTSGYTVYTSDLSEEYVDFNSAEYSAAIHAKRQRAWPEALVSISCFPLAMMRPLPRYPNHKNPPYFSKPCLTCRASVAARF
jgi:glutamate N-acetyltransferase/amino-acid N-acetyltransferase